MIVDTSVLIAIIQREPGYRDLVNTLRESDRLGIGTPTLTEAEIVLHSRFGLEARAIIDDFVREFQVEILPFSEKHWREAARAYRLFGKGHHPASLNYGDCMSYATARIANRPLLFVGNDFSQTDLPSP